MSKVHDALRQLTEALIEEQNTGRYAGVTVIQFGEHTKLIDMSGEVIAAMTGIVGKLGENLSEAVESYKKAQLKYAAKASLACGNT